MIDIQLPGSESVRRSHGALFVPSTPWKGFQHYLNYRAHRLGDKTALALAGSLDEPEKHSPISYFELSSASEGLAQRLVRLGIGPGCNIAILAESGPEWGLAFLGSMLAGAVFIPLDSKATLAELRTIIGECRPAVIFVSPGCRNMAQNLISICDLQAQVMDLASIRRISTRNQDIQPTSASSFADKGLHETALIVYTSGTTSGPKGVAITVSNLLFQAEKLVEAFQIRENDCFLSILPLNHLLELTCGMLGVIHGGAQTLYCRSLFPAEVTQALRTGKATYMITVPFFLRLLTREIRAEVETKSGFQKAWFSYWHRLSPILPESMRRGLFKHVHEALGGRLRGFISGGAPLDADTESYLARMGVQIYQGYGLTETSPVISVNRPGKTKFQSVGKTLPGVEVRIRNGGDGQEGEILTRGPHIMGGYHGRADLTEQAIDQEGWLRTGDLGYVDEDGFLFITGRIKSMIVLEGGKKVHPEEVESILSCLPSIQDVCVLMAAGENGKSELVAAVVPQKNRQIPALDIDVDRLEMEHRVREEIDFALTALSPYKRPTRIVFFQRDLPCTASRKIRREAVQAALQEKEI